MVRACGSGPCSVPSGASAHHAQVFHFDLRDPDHALLAVRVGHPGGPRRYGSRSLYTIDHNPMQPHIFAVAGTHPRALLYDVRTLNLGRHRTAAASYALAVRAHLCACWELSASTVSRGAVRMPRTTLSYGPALMTYGAPSLDRDPDTHITSVCFGPVRCPCANRTRAPARAQAQNAARLTRVLVSTPAQSVHCAPCSAARSCWRRTATRPFIALT